MRTSVQFETSGQIPVEVFIVLIIAFEIAQFDSALEVIGNRNGSCTAVLGIGGVPLDGNSLTSSPLGSGIRSGDMRVDDNSISQCEDKGNQE